MHIDHRYDAPYESRLSWLVIILAVTSVKYLGVVPDASIFGCLINHIQEAQLMLTTGSTRLLAVIRARAISDGTLT